MKIPRLSRAGKINLLLFLFFMPLLIKGGAVNSQAQWIPKQIMEWNAVGPDQEYDRQTIYKYIDGGAELYLAFDFREVFSRKYIGPEKNEIVLDLYDMGSPAEAFAIFTSEREDDEAHIGQGSEYGGGLLRFWKGRFFVSILTVGGGDRAEKAVLELGQAVAQGLPAAGSEPELLNHLPQMNLDKKKIRYFHTPLLLDKHYFVANENILQLNRKTECVLAEYPLAGQDSLILLLIKYENGTRAAEALAQFIKIYMPEGKGTGLAQMENKKSTMATREQNILRIVFEAPDKKVALDLQAAIKK